MVKVQVTEDGSHTLFSEMAGQTYHSSHGAVQESRHIFISQLELVNSQQSTVNSQRSTVNSQQTIDNGQQINVYSQQSTVNGQQTIDNGQQINVDSQQLVVNSQQSIVEGDLSVLEIGFGTGLNALLAACWAKENGVRVNFSTIELFPLESAVYEELNYGRLLGEDELFLKLHEAEWDAGLQEIVPEFAICKYKKDIVEWLDGQQSTVSSQQLGLYDVVFFDAFSPDAQPELWTEEVFRNVYGLMKEGGVMTTYCAKGDVRRAMLAAGFKVEKLQGPPGKRHILRAMK